MSKRQAPRAFVSINTLLSALVLSLCAGPMTHADGVDDKAQPMATPPKNFEADEALREFADNWTEMALKGEFAPFLGEDELKAEIIEILSQKKANTAYILGPPGAGKTSLIESLSGELGGREVWSLRLNALEAGTAYRGSLEDRLEAFFKNFIKDPNRILFIDEFHGVMKIPKFMDYLKPLMSARKITVLGGTTEDEFDRDVALVDAAAAGRAPVFRMEEHKPEKVLNILRLKVGKYEKEYKTKVRDEALRKIVKSTFMHYMDGTNTPTRVAERILERAIVRKNNDKIKGKVPFGALKFVGDRKMLQHNLERFKDELDRNQGIFDTSALERDIAETEKKIEGLDQEIARVMTNQEQDMLNDELAKYSRLIRDMQKDPEVQDDPEAMQTLTETIGKREKVLEKLRALGNGGPVLTTGDLTADDIGRFVARDLRMPEKYANETDAQKIERLRTELKEELFGQDHAIDALCAAIAQRLGNMDKAEGPIAVILAVGPPGVGKSTFEEKIAEIWFGDKSRVVGVEMNTVGRGGAWDFWGPSKGYVDSESGSKFEAVRRRPFSLISLREISRAHGSVYDALLQAVGKGEQADSRGRMINFRNSIFILDGNLTERYSLLRDHYSAEELEVEFKLPPGTFKGMDKDQMDQAMIDIEMDRQGFSSAFKDRVPIRLLFNPTTREMAKAILRSKLKKQKQHIEEEHHVEIDLGNLDGKAGEAPSLGDVLVDNFFDANRSGRYYNDVRMNLINPTLSALRLQVDKFPPGSKIKVFFEPAVNPAEGEAKGQIKFSLAFPGQDAKVFDGAKIFMRAVDKPSLSVGRTAGAAGHAVEEAKAGEHSDHQAGEMTRPVNMVRVNRKAPPTPRGR